MQARALGPEGRGHVAAVTVMAMLMSAILTFGLGEYAVAVGRLEGPRRRESMRVLASLSLLAAAIGWFVCIAVGSALAQGDPSLVALYRVASCLVPLLIIGQIVTMFAIGSENWVAASVPRSAMGVLSTVIISGLFAAGRLTPMLAVLALLIPQCLTAVILLALMRVGPGLITVRVFAQQETRKALRLASVTWLPSLAAIASQRVDVLLLAALTNAKEVGYYAVAVSISGFLGLPGYGMALTAKTDAAAGRMQSVLATARQSLLVTALLAMVLVGLSPTAIPLLFGSEFSPSISMTLVLCLAAPVLMVKIVLIQACLSSRRAGIAFRAEALGLAITLLGLGALVGSTSVLRPGVAASLVSLGSYLGSVAVLVRGFLSGTPGGMVAALLPHRADVAAAGSSLAGLARRRRRG